MVVVTKGALDEPLDGPLLRLTPDLSGTTRCIVALGPFILVVRSGVRRSAALMTVVPAGVRHLVGARRDDLVFLVPFVVVRLVPATSRMDGSGDSFGIVDFPLELAEGLEAIVRTAAAVLAADPDDRGGVATGPSARGPVGAVDLLVLLIGPSSSSTYGRAPRSGWTRFTPTDEPEPDRYTSSRRVCSAMRPPIYEKMMTMRYPFVPIPNVVVRASTKPRMYETMNSLYGTRNGRMLETPSLKTIGRDATKSI